MELAEQASMPMTPDQAVNLAYVISARQPILLQDLRVWHKKLQVDKTWQNMKTHLREAQDDLSSLPVTGSMYPNPQQANFAAITELVTQRILQEQANNANHQTHDLYVPPPSSCQSPVSFQTPSGALATHLPAPELDPSVSDQSALTDQFSAMTNSMQRREQDLKTREQQMLTQMQDMMSRMLAQNSNPPNTASNRSRNHQRSSGYGGRTHGAGNRNSPGNSTLPRKYCWSHGTCAHTDSECNTPSPGHQIAASFSNMMNGSTNNCYWLPPT